LRSEDSGLALYVTAAATRDSLRGTATYLPFDSVQPVQCDRLPPATLTPTHTPTSFVCTPGLRNCITATTPPPTLTPSNTPTPLPDTNCAGPTFDVDLIDSWLYNSYPTAFRQELLDMRVVSSTGVALLQTPVINGSRVGVTYPWNTRVKVFARVTFTQTEYSDQVWYQVGNAGDSAPLGWIIARYEGRNYVESGDPCNAVAAPSSLTFTYNRAAVRNYAVAHSYQNNQQLPSQLRVTKRLQTNPNQTPFANFTYADLSTGTGSAMFVSESIWAGGLPMTTGRQNSCEIAPDATGEYGWRACPSSGTGQGLSSPSWDYHEALGEYYTLAALLPGVSGSNSVLLESDKGKQITFVGLTNNDRIVDADIVPFLGGDATDGGVDNDQNPPVSTIDLNGMSLFARDNLGQGTNIIRSGDYLWINSYADTPSDAHGLIVVGWGATATCPDALSQVIPTTQLYVSYTDALNSSTSPKGLNGTIALVVPYVADFTTVQSPIARPFYCTRYDQPGRLGFIIHSWRFYQLPNQVSLAYDKNFLMPNSVYVAPNWEWTSSDGQ
jgi:hypothetical protein